MTTLSGRGMADNLRSLRHLVRTARRSHDSEQRARITRDARLMLEHIKKSYIEVAERAGKDIAALVSTLFELARGAFEIIETELAVTERGTRGK